MDCDRDKHSIAFRLQKTKEGAINPSVPRLYFHILRLNHILQRYLKFMRIIFDELHILLFEKAKTLGRIPKVRFIYHF